MIRIIVGIVHSLLPEKEALAKSGHIAQNVNFAANGQTVKSFLEKNNVPYKTDNWFTFEKADADIAEVAKKWTVLIECWK
jgi:IS1 family transposase